MLLNVVHYNNNGTIPGPLVGNRLAKRASGGADWPQEKPGASGDLGWGALARARADPGNSPGVYRDPAQGAARVTLDNPASSYFHFAPGLGVPLQAQEQRAPTTAARGCPYRGGVRADRSLPRAQSTHGPPVAHGRYRDCSYQSGAGQVASASGRRLQGRRRTDPASPAARGRRDEAG